MRAVVKRLLGSVADVRGDEWARLVPLALAYALVMVSLYVLKPARNALFLDQIGIARLPYVLVLVALFGALAAGVFAHFSRALRLDRLVLGTFLFLMANLLGFWLLLPLGLSWSFYLFYVWVNLFGLMATSLVWLMAGAAFNPRQGRRLFGLVGTGGIVGAIAGGAFTGWVVERVGTENLVLVCVLFLGAALLLLYFVRSEEAEASPRLERKAVAQSPLGTIVRTPLLRLLAGMAALAAAVAAVIDIQFNAIVDQAFPSKDAKTAFFGQFFASLSAFAFFFQILVTPRVLRSAGVIPALLFLPLSMAAGSLAVFLAPGLAAGIALKLGDGSFRHSIHKSAVEILFLPVPTAVKQRTKVLLDTTVDNMATGLGALLVLFLTVTVGLSYEYLSLLSLGLVGFWLCLVLHSRSHYVDAFRRALERREIDPGQMSVEADEAAALDSLVMALEDGRERQAVYALEMLTAVRARRLVEPLSRLLDHASAEVRQKALRALRNQSEIPLQRVEVLLADEDLQVRIEALCSLWTADPEKRRERLLAALASADAKQRSAAIGCVAEYGTVEENALVGEEHVRGLFHSGSGEVGERVQAAHVLGKLESTEVRPYLRELAGQLMADPQPEVVEQTIASLGRLRDREHLPWLLDKLGARRFRLAARQALVAYGTQAVPGLMARLDGGGVEAARVLAEIRHQEVVDLLLERLQGAEPEKEFALIKALSKLRGSGAPLHFAADRIDAVLEQALRLQGELLQLDLLYRGPGERPGERLLRRALREKQERNLERIFRLLGLRYPPRDMYHAYLGLVSRRPTLRASALEFLDNVLERELKERLLPVLDPGSPERSAYYAAQLSGRRLQDRQQAFAYLLESRDAWLRACAVHSVDGHPEAAELALLRRAQEDGHEMVREAARAVLGRLPS